MATKRPADRSDGGAQWKRTGEQHRHRHGRVRSVTGWDNDKTPTVGLGSGHPDNREALAFLDGHITANDENEDELQSTYEAIRSIRFPVGPRLLDQLLIAFKGKNKRSAENLKTGRLIFGR